MDSSSAETDTPAWIKRVEIDTQLPFRSVREAVTLFGEKVIVGEACVRNPRDKDDGVGLDDRRGTREREAGDHTTAELEETRQCLQKAKEESLLMETRLSCLKEELERTKEELHHLKTTNPDFSSSDDSEIQIKFIEDRHPGNKFEFLRSQAGSGGSSSSLHEFQKKRYVTFANPPSVAQVIIPEPDAMLQRHPSLKKPGKNKKKPMIPLIGSLFSKMKKNNPEVHHQFSPSPQILN